MGSVTRTVRPRMERSVPGERGTRAMATSSAGLSWMAEFSAVGSLAISSSCMSSFVGMLAHQYGFGSELKMDVELAVHGVNPRSAAIRWERNGRRIIGHGESFGFDVGQQLSDVHVGVALGAAGVGIDGDSPGITPYFLCFADSGIP